MVLRSDAAPFLKDESGKVYAKKVDVKDFDGNSYVDYDFENDRAYGLFEYMYENVMYLHCDPAFTGATSAINISEQDNSKGTSLNFNADLLVSSGSDVLYFIKPVYQQADGSVYAVIDEEFNQILTPDQATVSLKTNVKNEAEDYTTEYEACGSIAVKTGKLPTVIRILSFDAEGNCIRKDEFTPETFPETTYVKDENCEYMIVESESDDGTTREFIEKESLLMQVLAQEKDGIVMYKTCDLA